MRVELWKKIIERHDCPSDSSIHRHIKNISKVLVDTFETTKIPEIGEIIYYNDISDAYEIKKKIRVLENPDECLSEEVYIFEVEEYRADKLYSCGSSSWMEEIPLIVDIEENKKSF